MTQSQIASNIGLQSGFLSDVFSGRRLIGPKVAKRIANYLGDDDWRKFVHMPGGDLKQILFSKKRISKTRKGINREGTDPRI